MTEHDMSEAIRTAANGVSALCSIAHHAEGREYLRKNKRHIGVILAGAQLIASAIESDRDCNVVPFRQAAE